MSLIRSRRAARNPLVLLLAVAVAALGLSTPPRQAAAAGPEPISYAYDELGRLVGVTDPAGDTATYAYDANGNLTGITRQPSSQVAVLSLTPSRGAAGTTVTITGTGFAADPGDNQVTFAGTAATVSAASQTRLTVTVPDGAATGPVQVTTPTGSAASPRPFTVEPAAAAPVITGFTPSGGTRGTEVTITGSGFDPVPARNTVLFNQAVMARVTAATPTSLTVLAPEVGAGRIAVRTKAGTAVSADDFSVAPADYTLAEVDSATRIEVGGPSVTASVGTAGRIALLRFDGGKGQRLSLALTGKTIPTNLTVRLFSPVGIEFSANGFASPYTVTGDDSLEFPPLPAAGTYQVAIDPAGDGTGTVTATLLGDLDGGLLSTTGPGTEVSTTHPGQRARLAFDGAAGESYALAIAGISGGGSIRVVVKAPGGEAEVVSRSLSGDGAIQVGPLPAAGTYQVVIDPGMVTRTFTVTLSTAADFGALTPSGAAVTVTTARPAQPARLRFDGDAGQFFSLGVAGNTYPSGTSVTVFTPGGATLRSFSVFGASTDLDLPVLPATGTYEVLIRPSGAGTGGMAVTLSAQLDGGTLDRAGPGTGIAIDRPGQNARLRFDGAEGERLSLGFSNPTFGSLSITVLRPDGATFASTSISGADSIDLAPLPVTGTYDVVIDPGSGATGEVTVTLSAEVDGGVLTTTGPAAAVSAGRAGQNVRLRFDGEAGQRLSLGFTNVTFGGFYWVSVLRPDGTALVSSRLLSGTDDIDLAVLPATGTYEVLIDPDAARTGGVTVTLSAEVDAGTLTTEGASVPVSVGRAGQNARLRFEGAVGQRLSLGLTSPSFGGFYNVAVLRPDGSSLVSRLVSGTDDLDLAALTVAGTYEVVVNPDAARTGGVTLTLSAEIDGGVLTTTDPGVAVSVGRAGQNVRLRFDGEAGQRLSLGFTSVTFGGFYNVAVSRPDGSSLVSRLVSGTDDIDLAVLPATGTYEVLIDPDAARTGGVTLTLSAELDGGTLTTTDPGVAVSVGRAGQNARLRFEGAVGQRLSLGLTSPSFGGFYNVAVLRPDGSSLVSRLVSGTDDLDLAALTVAGTYEVVVNPDAARTGGVTLTLSAEVDAGTLTTGGPGVLASVGRAGQNARLRFDGAAGQRLTLGLTSPSFGGLYDVVVSRPDGSSLVSRLFSGAGSLALPVLPVTGAYAVVINPDAARTGGVTVALTVTPAQAGTSRAGGTAAGGAAAAGVGAAGDPERGGQAAGQDGADRDADRLIADLLRREQGAPAGTRPSKRAGAVLVGARSPAAGQPSVAGQPAGRPGTPAQPPGQPAEPVAGETGETWVPDAGNLGGMDWWTRLPKPEGRKAPARRAPRGVTALSGQAMTVDGRPLAGVTVRVGKVTGRTDATGRFLLTRLRPGHAELLVDARAVGRPARDYGIYEIGVELVRGRTTVLPSTIWLTRIDDAHTVRFASPTTDEVVVTTPRIPGLEVRLPAGSVVKDHAGKVVRELGITAIPVDRPPFPLPTHFRVPVYFTVQPGGSYVFPRGARIIYPNYTNLAPGTRVEFWHYDPEGRGWYVYGHGSVTADGRQVVPDPGVRVYELSGAMINAGLLGPLLGPLSDFLDWLSGDPVDLGTGLLVETHTDLALPDVLPISLTRTYRQADSASRPFGVGQNHEYGIFLESANQYQEADLVLANGGKIHYERISPGIGFNDAVFRSDGATNEWFGSTLTWNGNGWNLTRLDGLTYVFGENAPLQAIRDRNGNQITLTRTNRQNGNITQITSPNGKWIRLSYDTGNRITRAEDNLGRVVTYTYEGGRLRTVTDPAGKVTTYGWDSAGRLATITDPRGITYLSNAYDAEGRVERQVMPEGAVFEFDYTTDADGRITATEVTDPNGTVRRVTFNADGFVTGDTAALGTPREQSVTIEREPGSNRVLSVTDPLGRTATFEYDQAGNVDEVTELAGTAEAVTSRSVYGGPFNQVSEVVDPLGRTTRLSYDAAGNLTRVRDPLNRDVTFTYHPDGQPATIVDHLGNTTTFDYQLGDLVAVTDPQGRTLRQLTDPAGRVLEVTTAAGATTSFTYDARNQLTAVTDALGQVRSFTYDDNGNLVGRTDARGHTTTWTYDGADRVASFTDPLGETASYVYDPAGNLTRVTARSGKVTTLDYDELGRPTTVAYGVTASGGESTIGYTYDAADRLTQIVDSVAGTVTFDYDGLDRVTEEAGPQGTIAYTYDAAGRRTSMTVAGQPQVSYAYNAADQTTSISDGGQTVTFGYDAAGRLATIDLPGGLSQSYAYDNADQLTSITYRRGAEIIGDIAYGYDAAGRRVTAGGSFARTAIPAPMPAATYDAADRLVAVGSASLTYDADGNLTSDGTTTYTWDARGQLSGLARAGLSASFGYDPAGRRTSRTVNGTTTGYLYDGLNPVQERSGSTPTATLLTGGVDQYFTRTDASGTRTFLTDAIGSTLALARPDGTLATEYTYEPFGKASVSGEASGNPFRFTGREDDGTGLYHYRARYYHPGQQRFTSEDPLGLGGGASLYTYAFNEPTSLTDPTGEIPPLIAAAAVWCLRGAVAGGLIDYGIQRLAGRKVNWAQVGGSALIGCITGGAARYLRGAAAARGGAGPVLQGQAGLARAGIVQNTQRIWFTGANGARYYRVPDGLDNIARVLSEVKNVKSLSYTRQLRDYVAWAKANGYTVELWVNSTTRLTGPLQQAIARGDIILRILP